MKEATLEKLGPLLSFLRSYDALEETADHKFLLKGQDFIHFHDEPDGLWADAKLSKGRIRVSVASPSEQGELMERISKKLDALDSSTQPNKKYRRKNSRQG